MRYLAGIVLTIDHRILLVLSKNDQDDNKKRWSIPKGKIAPGESPFDAAKRELQEECGVDLDNLGLQKADCKDKGILKYKRKGERVHLYYFVSSLHKVELNPITQDHERIAALGFFNKDLAIELIKKKQRDFVDYLAVDNDVEIKRLPTLLQLRDTHG